MKIREEHREQIQWFAYYLFTGSLSSGLIANHPKYVGYLAKNPRDLEECFLFFAQLQSNENLTLNFNEITSRVGDLIISKLTNEKLNRKHTQTTELFQLNNKLDSFWSEYVRIATIFCNNSFPRPVGQFKLKEMCGTDAVPYFSVWTNTIEINEKGTPLNPEYAMKRANERLLLWDGNLPDDVELFSELELEQEIY